MREPYPSMGVRSLEQRLRDIGKIKTLVGVGVLAELFYLSLASMFPLPRLYASLPPWDFAKLTGYHLGGIVYLVALYTILFSGLAWVMWGASDNDDINESGLRRIIWGGVWLFALTLLFLYPIYAIDMLLYVVHTRIWLFHGANPLLVPAARFPHDIWMQLSGEWVKATSGYSPLWEVVAAVPGWLAGKYHVLGHMMGLKVLAGLSYVADVWLVDRLVAQTWPDRWGRIWRLLFFAWNPLVLLELVGNGHNDGLMLTFMLLALLLMGQERELGAHAAMGLAVLVKVTPLFVWPLLWLWGTARRETWTERVRYSMGVAMIVLLTVLAFVPFLWPNPSAWQALRESDAAGWSLQALFILVARALHLSQAFTRVQMAMRVVFVIAYMGLLLWSWHTFRKIRKAPMWLALPRIIHLWLATFALVILLFASNWRPWYATWFVALAALAASPPWYRGVFWLSFTTATGHVFWSDVRWRFSPYLSSLLAHVIGVLWVFGIPLIAGIRCWRLRTNSQVPTV